MHLTANIKTGLKAAVTLIALSWLNFFVTRGMAPVVAQVGSILVVLMSSLWMIQAIRNTRDVKYEGSISFWAAFFTAMQVGVIQALGMFVSTLIFMMVSQSAFREWSTPQDLDSSQAVVMAPGEQAVIMALLVLFLSTVMALILSLIIRRKTDDKATFSETQS